MKLPVTYIVGIGNSDDRLTQKRWSEYINALGIILAELRVDIHFFGYSASMSQWQSCSAVFEADSNELPVAKLQERLASLASEFGQDSIALTIGATTLVKAKP